MERRNTRWLKNRKAIFPPKESRRISKENRRITNQYEKQRKRRKNVPESEYDRNER